MNSRDPPDGQPLTRTEGEGETLDMPAGMKGFSQGQILGERYQVIEMLGRGGMGEVWHAFDLKLRVEVALKALRGDLFKSERRLELLRQEVRAAREVVSPNVCRIFDLIEVEGRELVSMEYVDGATLLGVLQERGPLELKEAQDIASQFLAGLEAIHKVGLIHRDIKPENIMLTRAGRVVVMDFGLARQEAEGGGSVSGTPAYMSPEQAAGQTVDARADVYAAGVVLAEMVSPDGIKSFESRQSVWEGVRSEPAKLPDSPWAPAIKKAVAKDREGRYNSAHTLTRALEDVTLRVEGAEDLHPYPGLASFTEEDAEYFFGREAEVEQMWRKLEGPPRMLGLVGPSGAGKTSFLQAGLVANAGAAWTCLICKPGNNPQLALSRGLAPEMAGDVDAMDLLLRFDDPEVATEVVSRWGRRATHAVLIVDQFEELFTQNGADEQRRFSELLSQIVLESDTHVLLSMRDDFLLRCHDHEALAPLFSDLTPLRAPVGGALRRALVQPATKCGYRFEDDDLVDEMLAEVEGERGALPLLAFAAARMWEKRDRETGLLTRQAYHDIDGVGGALARHAEATIDRIGGERIAIVRELFRNLVTAEGTRAVHEWDELLSVFDESRRESAEGGLRELVDARLLTSYEIREEDAEPTRQVEIIHESLLTNWPRLVRWQTQDQEGAQLRDELRQAARAWDEHGRHNDRLWTGTANREFQLWEERYPGGLTETEEAFAEAMNSLATRRRRHRRIAASAGLALAVVIAAVFGTLWRRSVQETRRAEAAKLLALAQMQLDKDPTEALAYVTACLELVDTEEAKVFAVRTLWKAPPASVLAGAGMSGRQPTFSPDGTRLVAFGHGEEVLVWSDDGDEPLRLPGHSVGPEVSIHAWWTSSELVVADYPAKRVRVLSMPEGTLVRTLEYSDPTWFQVGETHLFGIVQTTDPRNDHKIMRLMAWELPYGDVEELGSFDRTAHGARYRCFDPSGRGFIFINEDTVYFRPLPLRDNEPAVVIGRHDNDAGMIGRPSVREPDRFWSRDLVTGERRCWSLVNPSLKPLELPPQPPEAAKRRYAVHGGTGKWRIQGRYGSTAPWLWHLGILPDARPLELRANTSWYMSFMDIHPAGKWLVASSESWDQLVFFPLIKAYPSVVDGYSTNIRPVVFSPDGEWLATGWGDGTLRLWPVPSGNQREVRVREAPYVFLTNLVFDRTGEQLVTVGNGPDMYVVPVDGGSPRGLEGYSQDQLMYSAAFSPSGRFMATGSGYGSIEEKVLRIWDLETGDVQVFPLEPTGQQRSVSEDSLAGHEYGISGLAFIDESTLYSAGWDGIRTWDLGTGQSQVVVPRRPETMTSMAMSADRTIIVTRTVDDSSDPPKAMFQVHDVATGISRPLHGFGDRVDMAGLHGIDPTGRVVVTGDAEGVVRVGRIDGGAPHLLLGHEGPVSSVAISPGLEWVASSGQDETLRLWPMPDLSKPPLHTLPRDELIAKLKTLTNLRVVRDEESASGWKVEVGPFPGWAEVPTW